MTKTFNGGKGFMDGLPGAFDTESYEKKIEALLNEIDEVNATGKYRPDWESLSSHPVPEWYKNSRFGIFIHWGAYSVPAYLNE